MSDRERARQVLRRIHESNVRLSFGPGMHVMTPDTFVFDAVLEALEEVRIQARAEGLRQAAEVVEGMSRNPVYGTEPSASVLVASGHVAARLRALAEGGE